VRTLGWEWVHLDELGHGLYSVAPKDRAYALYPMMASRFPRSSKQGKHHYPPLR